MLIVSLKLLLIDVTKASYSISSCCLTDPDYRKAVPNLDGVEQHSELILFGADTNFGGK